MSVKPVVRSAVMAASCSPDRANSMSLSRLFVDQDLGPGIEAPLGEAQVHYLRNVMRRPDGAPLLLFNGRDGEWRGTLEGRGKKAAVARIAERTREQLVEPDIWLCFAPLKRARIDYVAEKATELGVAVLQPIVTHHTIVERVNVERLRANAVEAAEHSSLRRIKDVMSVGLGPRILRADTAALAALACWQALVGDWQRPTPRLEGDYRTSRAA